MYFSKSFIPILKNNPTEAKIKSHQLMLRVGMIKQSSAGIYSWLPLGFKVMKKIEQIVREEQDRVGVQEILMPTIQSSEIWKESGRYDDYGEEMLRIKDRQNREKKENIEGVDPGAPENPKILKKIGYSTLITSIIFIIIYLLVKYEYFNLRNFIN